MASLPPQLPSSLTASLTFATGVLLLEATVLAVVGFVMVVVVLVEVLEELTGLVATLGGWLLEEVVAALGSTGASPQRPKADWQPAPQ